MLIVILKNMLTWEDLKKYDGTQVQGVVFQREESVMAKYHEYKSNVSNINLHILQEVLKDKPYILVKNKYPYLVERGIIHCVFWMQPDKKIPLSTVKQMYPHAIIFENPPGAQSVQGVPHYQVFISVKP